MNRPEMDEIIDRVLPELGRTDLAGVGRAALYTLLEEAYSAGVAQGLRRVVNDAPVPDSGVARPHTCVKCLRLFNTTNRRAQYCPRCAGAGF